MATTKKEKPKKRDKGRFASVYYKDQMPALDAIALEQSESTGRSVSRADLLREAADYVIAKYTDLQKGDE